MKDPPSWTSCRRRHRRRRRNTHFLRLLFPLKSFARRVRCETIKKATSIKLNQIQINPMLCMPFCLGCFPQAKERSKKTENDTNKPNQEGARCEKINFVFGAQPLRTTKLRIEPKLVTRFVPGLNYENFHSRTA
jgi:hypothetical protein